MVFIASLAVGANNATTLKGSSTELSTPADRARFLALHRSASAIIIGKQSALSEDYLKTKVPIYVFSRSPEKLMLDHPQMEQILVNADLADISRDIYRRTSGNVVIEAGPQLLTALVKAGVVDLLQLSITSINGDANFIDIDDLLTYFNVESEDFSEGTRLLQCRYNGNATNS